MTDLGAVAREIIDETLYLVLATADADGRPWASPVYCAHAGYVEFYWISSPEVTHSRNIAQRPQVSIVLFDSRQPPSTGRGVYLEALAEQVPDADVDVALTVYNGRSDPDTGGRAFGRDQVTGPAPYRMYRATVSRYSMLCPRPVGRPCDEHGMAVDHRIEVTV